MLLFSPARNARTLVCADFTVGCCWFRRGRVALPVLWAVLPFFAIGIFEKVVFNSSHFAASCRSIFSEAVKVGTRRRRADRWIDGHLGLGQFLASPGLWIGLAIAAAFLAGAVPFAA